MKKPELILVAPSELTVHPIARHMPEWDNEDPRFLSMIEDIRERGLDQPLQADGTNRVVDGRHRLRAAKRLKLDSVPVLVRADGEVAEVIVNSLLQRRHYSKGGLAYLTYPLLEAAHNDRRSRHLERLKTGNKPTIGHSVAYGPKVAELAAQIGVSRQLFDQAAEVHRIFTEDPEYKAAMEPQILDHDDPAGLGGVIAGWAGKNRCKGRPKTQHAPLRLFAEGWKTVKTRFSLWDKMDEEAQSEAVQILRTVISEMPQGLRDQVKAVIRLTEREQS